MGVDYLYELGRQSASMRTEVGAKRGQVDDLFTGRFLGVDADIASGELRYSEVRTLSNVVDGCHVPPRFLDRVAVHLVKNVIADPSRDAGRVGGGGISGVPLILGIWGEKGCGKSFGAWPYIGPFSQLNLSTLDGDNLSTSGG